jgi:predicted peptidase
LGKTISEFPIDEKRVYLTGMSAGGNGAWYLAYHHPERFAGVLIACGFVDEFTGRQSKLRYPPIVSGPVDAAYREIAKRLAKVPIWLFHGDADPTVNVSVSRGMYAALKAEEANVQYTELPGVGHNAWDPAYARSDAIEWLLVQRRE